MKQTPSAVDIEIVDLEARLSARKTDVSEGRRARIARSAPAPESRKREPVTREVAVVAQLGAPTKNAAPSVEARDPLWMRIGALMFYTMCVLVLWWGWEVKDQHYISAKFGVGYALGIIGTTLMALLLLYPARKRARAFRNLGPIRYWFRVHMVFGVIGPILVVFHCNFSLGSFNSETVLLCTLIVSLSGFFGRYFYARVHHGLYGHKASLEELQRDFVEIQKRGSVFSQLLPTVMEDLVRVERPMLSPTGKLEPGVGTALLTGITTRWAYLRIRMKLSRALDDAAKTSPIVARERARLESNSRRYAAGRLEKLRKFAQFLMFERLFSIWHVVHYPLFVVLVVAVIVHIVAVHMY